MSARGQRIRLAMELRGIHKQYALAMDIGVDQSNLSRWCRGAPLSVEHAIRLCEALDVSLDWLLLGRGDIEQHKGNCARPGEWEFILSMRTLHPSVSESIRSHVNQLSQILNPTKTKLPPPITSTPTALAQASPSDASGQTATDSEPQLQPHNESGIDNDPDYKDSPLI